MVGLKTRRRFHVIMIMPAHEGKNLPDRQENFEPIPKSPTGWEACLTFAV
jgi:hypothetical protein